MIVARVAIGLAAIALTGASLTMSLWYASQLAGAPVRYVWLAVAAACGVLVVVLPSQFHGATWRGSAGLRTVWLVGFLLHACFVGGFAIMVREDHQAPLIAAHRARETLRVNLSDARAKLANIQAPREAEQIAADLRVSQAAAPNCRRAEDFTRDPCKMFSHYEREDAAAKAWRRLQTEVAALDKQLTAAREIVLYPEARRPAEWLRGAGVSITDAQMSSLIWTLMLLFMDLGAMSAFRHAVAPSAAARRSLPVAAPAHPSVPVRPATPRSVPVASDAGRRLLTAVSDAASGRGALASAATADGWVRVSQRSGYVAAGVPSRVVTTTLAALVTDGKLQMRAGSRGAEYQRVN